MAESFSKKSSKIIHQNPYWNYKLDEYIIPSGDMRDYYYADSRGSSIIIPKIDDKHFILIEQYRYLNQKISIEFPGGGLIPNISYPENALKELEEETGYKTDINSLTLIGEFNPCIGMTNEICKVYIAENLQQTIQQPDEEEEIKILVLNPDEINSMIKSNKIWSGMSISSWFFYVSKFMI
jgi:ADP-ribose pyrophosphatase